MRIAVLASVTLLGIGAISGAEASSAISQSQRSHTSHHQPAHLWLLETSHHRFVQIRRVVHLPAGQVVEHFRFHINAKFPERGLLVVPRGARVSVYAHSRGGVMGLSIYRWGGKNCRHDGKRDVCRQDWEHCPLVSGAWRVAVIKKTEAPVVARVRLVFVR